MICFNDVIPAIWRVFLLRKCVITCGECRRPWFGNRIAMRFVRHVSCMVLSNRVARPQLVLVVRIDSIGLGAILSRHLCTAKYLSEWRRRHFFIYKNFDKVKISTLFLQRCSCDEIAEFLRQALLAIGFLLSSLLCPVLKNRFRFSNWLIGRFQAVLGCPSSWIRDFLANEIMA